MRPTRVPRSHTARVYAVKDGGQETPRPARPRVSHRPLRPFLWRQDKRLGPPAHQTPGVDPGFARGRCPARPPSAARRVLSHPPIFFRVHPRRPRPPETVESLAYPRKLAARTRASAEACRSRALFEVRFQQFPRVLVRQLGFGAGALPRGRRPPPSAVGRHVTLDRGDAHAEGASGLDLGHPPLGGLADLLLPLAQVFSWVGVRPLTKPDGPTVLQVALGR